MLKAEELIYSNPDEAIKIAQHLLKTNKNAQEKTVTKLLLAKSYLVKGDYNQSILNAFDNYSQLQHIDPSTQIEVNILKANLLKNIFLDKKAKEYLLLASKLNKEIVKTKLKDSLQSLIDIEKISIHLSRQENDKALIEIKKTENKLNHFYKNNISEKKNLYFLKEQVYNNLTLYDSASVYMNKTLSLLEIEKTNNLYQKSLIYRELGKLYLLKKEFKKSEENLFIASKFAEIINNPIVLTKINKDLSINYLASNKKSQHKVYNDKYLVLDTQVEQMEQESVNTLYNMLTSQNEVILKNEAKTYQNYIYLLLAGILAIILIGVYFLTKNINKEKRLKEIIKYLEISRNNYTKPTKKTVTKGIHIPEDTEKQILAKLKKFEMSNKFLNNEMSLAVLAGQFETNTKYLSGVINKHYHDNFKTFINKLRINYIINKLQNYPNYINYKISFLAEESGYSSHSSFATVFKSIIGMSPVTFIKLIQEERKELKSKKAL